MNILSLSLEQTGIKDTNLLNWLCSPPTGKGVNHERYWIIKTDTQMVNVHGDRDVDTLTNLLINAHMQNFSSLMITKNEQTRSEQRDTPPDGGAGGETPGAEVPPTDVGVQPDGT